MTQIIIGTTPTIIYTFKTVSPSDFRACILTIKCNGQILIEKILADAEISRIQTARNTLRTKAVDLDIGTFTDKLDILVTVFSGIINRRAVSAQVQKGDTYIIPVGYHNGSSSNASGVYF